MTTEPRRFPAARLTASTFRLLGEQALLGRVFTDEEDLQENMDLVTLAYHVWVNRYGRDPAIIGQTIRASARPTTVIGVMPEGFRFPERSDMWLPLNVDPGVVERGEGPGFGCLAGSRDASTEVDARTQLTAIATRLEQQYPEANEDIVPVVEPWMDVAFVDDETRGILYTMFAAVIGVLLIACANVANLLFGITITRGKELAIRTAMGAARNRVFRQILAETLVLATAGAALGVILSKFSLDLFERVVAPLAPPPWMVFELSSGVLLFTVGITFFAAIVAGFLPAIQATRGDVHGLLQDQSRGSSSRSVSRWSAGLVVVEVALSCALLIAAGLTTRSTIEVNESDFGIDRTGIFTARLSFPTEVYPDSTARLQITEQLRTDLEQLPGVREVALSSNLPVMGTSLRFYGVSDREYANDGEYSFGGYTFVTPSFFDVLRVPLVSGRFLDEGDALGNQRVVMVDERFADRNWPGQDPLGKQVRLGRSDSENSWLTVVGVVRTFEMLQPLNFLANPPEGMFVPIAQQPVGGVSVMLRAAGPPSQWLVPYGISSPVWMPTSPSTTSTPLSSASTTPAWISGSSAECSPPSASSPSSWRPWASTPSWRSLWGGGHPRWAFGWRSVRTPGASFA